MMALEMNRGGSIYVYRISPADARNIERKENKFRGRWYFYARRDTAGDARRTLLMLEKDGE